MRSRSSPKCSSAVPSRAREWTCTPFAATSPSGFTGGWSGSIGAGGAQTITITFSPTAAVNYGGTLTVNSNASSGTSTILATGTGTGLVTVTIYSRTPDGKPLPGVALTVTDASGNKATYVTGGDGSALVSGAAGAWVVDFAKAGYQPEGPWQGSVTASGMVLYGYLLPT